MRDIARRAPNSPDRRAAAPALTGRQVEILRLISEGKSDRDIAAALGVSEHTVHRHVANILLRLDLPTRAAAAAYSASRGFI
jgi:DNA-binding NarL/FixJ family response regulator